MTARKNALFDLLRHQAGEFFQSAPITGDTHMN